jgi:hypothetical protein
MREAERGGNEKTTEKETAKAQTKKNSGHRRTASQAPNDAVQMRMRTNRVIWEESQKEVWVR